MTTVLKLGGELLDDRPALQSAAAAVVRLTAAGPVIVVHGGGRAVDTELRARGETPKYVDGLRITDEAALNAAVSVLAGRTNTALVAAVGIAGGRAVGLTGADGLLGLCERAGHLRRAGGEMVDLGLVGEPVSRDVSLLVDLMRIGCTPIIASIGVTRDGELLNINADSLAAHLASVLSAERLIVAGAIPGVLDTSGSTIPVLSLDAVDRMISSGEAHSGMVAKLVACRAALEAGVREVAIVCGRGVDDFEKTAGTLLCRQMATI